MALLTLGTGLSACHHATPGSSAAESPAAISSELAIRRLLGQWQAGQVRTRRLWARDSCRPQWFAHHVAANTLDAALGLPDSTEIQYDFADLNGDGKPDGLMAFTPAQCDGGNGSMWVQEKVFALSSGKGYRLNDTMAIEKFAGARGGDQGFYWLDSLGPGKVYGTYFEFGAGDGHCCPGIRQMVVFDFARRKLVYPGPDKAR